MHTIVKKGHTMSVGKNQYNIINSFQSPRIQFYLKLWTNSTNFTLHRIGIKTNRLGELKCTCLDTLDSQRCSTFVRDLRGTIGTGLIHTYIYIAPCFTAFQKKARSADGDSPEEQEPGVWSMFRIYAVIIRIRNPVPFILVKWIFAHQTGTQSKHRSTSKAKHSFVNCRHHYHHPTTTTPPQPWPPPHHHIKHSVPPHSKLHACLDLPYHIPTTIRKSKKATDKKT